MNDYNINPEPGTDFQPSSFYRISVPRNRAWWGPRYTRTGLWIHDLQNVLTNLCMLSGGSGSVAAGLAACAAEENRNARYLLYGLLLCFCTLLSVVLGTSFISLLVVSDTYALIVLSVVGITLFGGLYALLLKYAPGKHGDEEWVILPGPLALFENRVIGLGSSLLIPGGCIFVLQIFDYPHSSLVTLLIYGLILVLTLFLISVLILLFRSFAAAQREAVYLKLRDDVLNGLSLAEAMLRMKRFFPQYYADIALVGEDTGSWKATMEDLCKHASQYCEHYARTQMTLMYIGSSLLFQLGIIGFLMVKVVPVFGEIFAEMGAALPQPTLVLMRLMDYSVSTLWLQLLILSAIPLGNGYLLWRWLTPRRARNTRFPNGLLLRIPFIRRMVVYQNVHMVSYILSRLLDAGVPLPQALQTASNADLQPTFRRTLRRLQTQVEHGESIGEVFEKRSWLFTHSFCTFVRIGERSGMLPESLYQLSDRFGEERDRMANILNNSFGPFLILLMGLWTLFVLIALYLPIFTLSDALIGSM